MEGGVNIGAEVWQFPRVACRVWEGCWKQTLVGAIEAEDSRSPIAILMDVPFPPVQDRCAWPDTAVEPAAELESVW